MIMNNRKIYQVQLATSIIFSFISFQLFQKIFTRVALLFYFSFIIHFLTEFTYRIPIQSIWLLVSHNETDTYIFRFKRTIYATYTVKIREYHEEMNYV